MKNKLFGKQLTALIMGSLMIFSGQALAFSSNDRELRNTSVLGNSEFFIAQCMSTECQSELVEPQEQFALAQSISRALTAVGNAQAVTQVSSIPNTVEVDIVRLLSQTVTILGYAYADAQSATLTRGDVAEIAESLAAAETFLGDAEAIAESGVAIGGLAQAIAEAREAVGDARSIAVIIAYT